MHREPWDTRPTHTVLPDYRYAATHDHLAAIHRRRRRRRMRNVVIATVLVEILALCAWATLSGSFGPQPAIPPAVAADRPDVSSDAGDEDLPAPERATVTPSQRAAAPARRSAYKFALMQNDHKKPVAYDPCRRIHYVIREQGSPPGGAQLITDAVQRVAKATGLQFVYDGESNEPPSAKRPAVQVARYGDRWAPVLISWVTVKENPRFKGNVAGEAGSAAVSTDGSPLVYVTGTVSLDGPQMAKILAERHGPDRARAIVLHELGHLVGLGHVNDKTQLMYPQGQPGVTDFASGDLKGLAALGGGACVARLQHP